MKMRCYVVTGVRGGAAVVVDLKSEYLIFVDLFFSCEFLIVSVYLDLLILLLFIFRPDMALLEYIRLYHHISHGVGSDRMREGERKMTKIEEEVK